MKSRCDQCKIEFFYSVEGQVHPKNVRRFCPTCNNLRRKINRNSTIKSIIKVPEKVIEKKWMKWDETCVFV